MQTLEDGPTPALLQEIIDAFNSHDVERLGVFFAEDAEMVLAAGPEIWGTRVVGRAAIQDALRERFAAIPDIRWTDGRSWIMGGKAISEWRVQGTPPSGKPIDCLGCDLWEFEAGKIRKKDTYYKIVTS